jgi:CYTH domain-containing protein
MDHPDAPEGKALKYARAERERRFLLARIPEGPCVERAEITDLYLTGTRLRLRQAVQTTTAGSTVSRKFTQKIPAAGGRPGLITTTYVNEAEYAVLSVLPGTELSKTRYGVPPYAIDVFAGKLAGLVLAEVEFENAREEESYEVPSDVVAEVTVDPRLSGGRLALTSRSDLLSLLAEFGLEPLNAPQLAGRPLTGPS